MLQVSCQVNGIPIQLINCKDVPALWEAISNAASSDLYESLPRSVSRMNLLFGGNCIESD